MLHTVCAGLGLLFCSVVLENWFQNGDDMNQKVKSCLKSSKLLEAVNFTVHELSNILWKNKAKVVYAWLSFFLILSCMAWKVDQNFLCCCKAFLQFWWPESLTESSHLLAWSQRVRCAIFKYNIKVTRRGVDGEGIDSTTVATTEIPSCGCKDTVCQNCVLST